MTKLITIANEKGGVGKTTTAVNLASGLAIRLADGRTPEPRILLVDMDPQGHALLATAFGDHQAEPGGSLASLLTETPPPSIQRMLRQSTHHPNLFVVPGNRTAMIDAARILPTLMANESRLQRALQPVIGQFDFIIIDTPPTSGDLLINALVAATHIVIPVETTYLGVSGLRELQQTIEAVRTHFHPDLQIAGFLPTLCDESRSETKEILAELDNRFPGRVFPAIHKASDLSYAHSAHMDIFTYRPPRYREKGQLTSSSRATQEYAALIESLLGKLQDLDQER